MKKLSSLIFVALLALQPLVAFAQSSSSAPVPVEVEVPSASLRVSGYAAPQSLVTFQLDGSVIGSTATGSSAAFDKVFPAIEPGIHMLSVFFKDSAGISSDPISKSISISAQQQTAVELFLPPSVALSQNSVYAGQPLIARGYSVENARVNLSLDNNVTYTIATDNTGRWQELVSTGGLVGALHSVRAQGQLTNGDQSPYSTPRNFELTFSDDSEGIPEPVNPAVALPAPSIISPTDQYQSPLHRIAVSGSGVAQSQLELYDGDQLIGSIYINANGRWELPIRLNESSYALRARVCQQDTCSPFSNTVTVYRAFSPDINRFLYELDTYRFHSVNVDQPAVQHVRFVEGHPPFEIVIDWGDGAVERLQAPTDRLFRLEHAYQRAGNYSATITIEDGQNQRDIQYFSVEVRQQPANTTLAFISVPLSVIFGVAIVQWYQRQKRLPKTSLRPPRR